MNKIPRLIIALSALAFTVIACYKTNNSFTSKTDTNISSVDKRATATSSKATTAIPESLFSKNTGGIVPGDSGRAWTANYNKGYSSISKSYSLKAAELKEILEMDSCVGIIFYHADNGSGWLVLPFGITASGKILKSNKVYTQAGHINAEKAGRWIRAYQTAHMGSPNAHFFGSTLLNTLFDQYSIVNLSLQMGWNSKGEQLILGNTDFASASISGDISRVPPPGSVIDDPSSF